MFNKLFHKITRPVFSNETLEDYHQQRKVFEAMEKEKMRENIPFTETRRPARTCDEVIAYKECIIEEYQSPWGNKYRVSFPQNTVGGRLGNGGGMWDAGVEFTRLGDAYNYIDDSY